jgi:hypothetical protein
MILFRTIGAIIIFIDYYNIVVDAWQDLACKGSWVGLLS